MAGSDPREQAKLKPAWVLRMRRQLQGWFTAQIGAYLEAARPPDGRMGRGARRWRSGRRDSDVVAWYRRGTRGGPQRSHDAVLAPAPVFYLDNRQSDSP